MKPHAHTSASRIVVFPYARRRTLIARVACDLRSAATPQERELSWHSAVSEIETELHTCGACNAEIEAHLWTFYHAINVYSKTLSRAGHRVSPPDCAMRDRGPPMYMADGRTQTNRATSGADWSTDARDEQVRLSHFAVPFPPDRRP